MKTSAIFKLTLAWLVLILLISCEPTPVTPPLMTVNPTSDVTAAPGSTVTYQILINSDTELKTAGITAKSNNTVITTKDSVFPAGIESAIIDFNFIVPAAAADGSVITLTFTASNTEQTILTRTINVIIPAGEIHTYTAVIMSDLENPEGKSFYSIEDNIRMNINEAIAASATVDLIYYYGATNKATLCGPADKSVEAFKDSKNEVIVQKFATRNNTKLAAVTMTVAEFNAVVNDVPIKVKTPATTNTAVPNLAKDNIIWCEAVSGKKALVKVVSITGTQSNSFITIEVKVQK